MFKRALLASLALAAISSAQAFTITVAPPPADTVETVFDSVNGDFRQPGDFYSHGYSFSGDAFINQGTSGVAAEPAGLGHNYLAVLAGGSETISFARPQDSFSIYWGSVDAYNSLTVDGQTITGATLVSYGLQDNGDRFSPLSNAVVTFSGLQGARGFSIASSANSFEFELAPIAAPEASTWVMMLLGFAGLFGISRRRQPRLGGI